ncbi:LacI family DNA-binding transcriptional regulator [Brachybacterium hainanense]|uniref:LacI family DNA-binding transcriptional regulator n=1 Tax=Brachybacterium hainanense TaxID=1541174 RepID=A0ABV6R7P2_9MICO
MRRPTIADIARDCGVSTASVSFALNGRPGLSEATRERILGRARELGWTPHAAARALSSSKVGAIGLVITAPFATLAQDTFYLRLIAGIEAELDSTPIALVLKMVESLEDELAAIRTWHAENRVDAVALVNPRTDDPRPALVARLGLRAVFFGDTRGYPEASSVFVDDAQVMTNLLADAAQLGYRSLAYLHAASDYRHSQARLDALTAAVPDPAGGSETSGAGGFTAAVALPIIETSDEATRDQVASHIDALVGEGMPDLLLCEDEAITLATLARLDHHGLAIARDVGVISWESTPGLGMRSPTISAIDRDPKILGSAAVQVLRALETSSEPIRRVIDPPRLVPRDSLRSPAAAPGSRR